MAERKPLSLNERNNRLLQDLSRSRPAKPPAPSADEKVQKVKLQGRRRLCKLSSEATDENSPVATFDSPSEKETDGEKRTGDILDAVTAFDSPPEKEIDGEERIRDILDELTSKLESLSVQKKKKPAGSAHDPEPQEFGSANSSLSPSSFLCDADVEEEIEIKIKRCDIKGKTAEGLVSKEEEVNRGYAKGEAVEALIVEEEEDDCVVLGSAVRSPRKEYSNCTVEVLDDDSEGSLADDEDGNPITFGGSGRCRDATYFLPGKIAKTLYTHQRDGLRWLWSLHCSDSGGILGDDMGLGKTMQISSFLAGLFHSHLIKRALIVAPKTLLSHWTKELSVVGLAKKIKDYFGVCTRTRQYELHDVLKEGGVLLTTYDIVRNNSKSIRGDHYLFGDNSEDEVVWDYVILDEGHLIKNPSTQRAKSLLEIPSSHRVIISGTPIQNNLKELWALFNFCCPRVLGDKQEFKERYEFPILRGNEKNASAREKGRGSAVAKELRERIKPYFLRRLKSEVFLESDATQSVKLSKKNELIVWLRLSQCQRQLYEAFLESDLVHSSVDGSPLAAITILKKICDHPLLLTKRAAEGVLEGMDTMLNRNDLSMVEEMALKLANMTHSEDAQPVDNSVSCKICFIMSLLENLVSEGHSVLIFSQTRKMLNLIQETILSMGYAFSRIDGTTKISDREKIVNDFQTGNGGSIFMLTSQVGGLGLTLTKADRVIVVDPAWNPSTDNQSVDRAYRIGQKKDVIVYRLMTCGTIEEKIYKMQIFKGGLFKTATEQKEQTRYFSQKDIRELFSLPEQGFDVSLTQKQLNEEHDCHHTMAESLKNHILFLENQGIAGVSQHSLLYSKTATVLVEEDEVHRNGNVFMGSYPSSSSTDLDVNAAAYAFNPKDVKSSTNLVRDSTTSKLKEKQEIEEQIKRLSRTLENKALVSNLSDKGEKIRRRIFELNSELRKSDDREELEVINLDNLTEDLQKIYV